MHRWRGRIALVTGASSGIGRAIAARLLAHRLNVVACDQHAEALESIRDEAAAECGDGVGELLAVKCDISKEADILAMFEQIKASKLGGVDVCVNCAGIGPLGKLAEQSTEEWRRMLDVNVLGLSICTREALRSMRERGVDDGHIIHMSSIRACIVGPQRAMYSATKHAVKALTEGLRQELLAERSGIRVTAISPDLVRSNFLETAVGNKEDAASVYAERNFMLPGDVAGAMIDALSAPQHVQVHEIVLWPLAQPETT